MSGAEFFSILSVAALSSVGHCAGMCGGFAILLARFLSGKGKIFSAAMIAGYNLARICAYILLGFIFGSLGGVFTLSLAARGYLFFAIGVFMAVLGVALIRRGTLLNFIEKNAFLSKILNEKMKAAISKNSVPGFLVLGFLNGLLPCGVVVFFFYFLGAIGRGANGAGGTAEVLIVLCFLALAVASGSEAKGAAITATFGIVSFFAMSFYALVLKALSEKFKKQALNLSGAAIIIYGIYLAFIGFTASNG